MYLGGLRWQPLAFIRTVLGHPNSLALVFMRSIKRRLDRGHRLWPTWGVDLHLDGIHGHGNQLHKELYQSTPATILLFEISWILPIAWSEAVAAVTVSLLIAICYIQTRDRASWLTHAGGSLSFIDIVFPKNISRITVNNERRMWTVNGFGRVIWMASFAPYPTNSSTLFQLAGTFETRRGKWSINVYHKLFASRQTNQLEVWNKPNLHALSSCLPMEEANQRDSLLVLACTEAKKLSGPSSAIGPVY